MYEYETEHATICKSSEIGLILIQGKWNIYDAINQCRKLKGKINVISDKENNDDLVEILNNTKACRKYH